MKEGILGVHIDVKLGRRLVFLIVALGRSKGVLQAPLAVQILEVQIGSVLQITEGRCRK